MNFDHDTFESPSWVDPGSTHRYANTVTPKPPRIDREQAHRMLALLGKDPSTTRLRAFAHKDNPDKARLSARSGAWDLDSAEQWQAAGRGLYLVINDGGGTKASITACRAVFVEWDDKPIEWQRTAWQELGLPEPTFQVETGGKSVHTYWTLAETLPREQWEPLQARLIEHCGSDPACKDASRVMRLAGAYYIGADGLPMAQSKLIECSGQPVALETLLAALPAEAPPPPPPAERSTSSRDTRPAIWSRSRQRSTWCPGDRLPPTSCSAICSAA